MQLSSPDSAPAPMAGLLQTCPANLTRALIRFITQSAARSILAAATRGPSTPCRFNHRLRAKSRDTPAKPLIGNVRLRDAMPHCAMPSSIPSHAAAHEHALTVSRVPSQRNHTPLQCNSAASVISLATAPSASVSAHALTHSTEDEAQGSPDQRHEQP